MKLRMMLCLLILTVLCTRVAAEEVGTYASAGELFRSWGENFPDALGGVWSTDGSTENLTFGVTNDEAGEALREEILRLVRNDNSVTIVTQTYSKRYLQAVQEEIFPYFEDIEIGMVSMGIHESENVLHIDILAEKVGTEKTEAFLAMAAEKYGTAVRVDCTATGYATTQGGITLYPLDMKDAQILVTKPDERPWQFAVFAVGALVLLAGASVTAKIRRSALRRTDGSVVSGVSHFTRKETEDAVRNRTPVLPRELDGRVWDSIRHTNET